MSLGFLFFQMIYDIEYGCWGNFSVLISLDYMYEEIIGIGVALLRMPATD